MLVVAFLFCICSGEKTMKINFKWIVKNLPGWLILLILISLIAGGFEGVVNGIILGKFPNLVGASSEKLIQF